MNYQHLGKLLADYLATSTDTLAVAFRTFYARPDQVHAQQPAAAVPKRKPSAPRLTTDTFSYRWSQTDSHRITLLYQRLLRAKWIAADTEPADFLALFSGNHSNCKIRWIGKKTCLVYLFRLLTDRQYITLPKISMRWIVVRNHFSDARNRMFTRLNGQRIPLQEKDVINQLAEGLNAAKSL